MRIIVDREHFRMGRYLRKLDTLPSRSCVLNMAIRDASGYGNVGVGLEKASVNEQVYKLPETAIKLREWFDFGYDARVEAALPFVFYLPIPD